MAYIDMPKDLRFACLTNICNWFPRRRANHPYSQKLVIIEGIVRPEILLRMLFEIIISRIQ